MSDYPDDDELATLASWTGSPATLVEYLLADHWWTPEFGLRVAEGTDEEPTVPDGGQATHRWLLLSTGGWSGNEDRIEALRDGRNGISWFWIRWWFASRVGGHYRFRVPLDQWFEPTMDGDVWAVEAPKAEPAAIDLGSLQERILSVLLASRHSAFDEVPLRAWVSGIVDAILPPGSPAVPAPEFTAAGGDVEAIRARIGAEFAKVNCDGVALCTGCHDAPCWHLEAHRLLVDVTADLAAARAENALLRHRAAAPVS